MSSGLVGGELSGRNPSEEIGPLDDAESPPRLMSSSSASAEGVCWSDSSSSTSTRSAAKLEATGHLAVSNARRRNDSR